MIKGYLTLIYHRVFLKIFLRKDILYKALSVRNYGVSGHLVL
ncbi:hypothetical protein VME0621_03547 [Vibrio mediterranei]|nr:hypothetical protein VME0621_03547 [Vibrio mediterranei]